MLSPQLSILHIWCYLKLHDDVTSTVQTVFRGLEKLRICLQPLIGWLQGQDLNLDQSDSGIHDADTACPSSLSISFL